MELKDEIIINAPQDEVYAALNDAETLKHCIPGCEELVKHSDTELEAKVVLKVGPVKAKFSGTVTLSPDAPPARFSLTGAGNGGAAGYAKGGAEVDLEAHPDGTLLRYVAKAEIGGKLAQLGSRLIQGTEKSLRRNFSVALPNRLAPRMPADGWILYAEHAQDTLATTLDLMRSGKPCALVNSPNIEGGGSLALRR